MAAEGSRVFHENHTPRLVIAGASSGVGKTTVAVGVMAALRARGLAVQPFKVGPDYIDPSYHTAATGVPSRNLDSWMVPWDSLLQLFARACGGADVAVVEGVMGVFDGLSGLDEAGSTAQVAKRLGAPVLLVVDVSGMARSAAAVALGYSRFDPDLRVAGFLLNNVGSETHYRWAKEAIEAAGVGRVLGYLPKDPRLILPERHLGLVPAVERPLPEDFLERLVGLVEAHVDLDEVLAVSRQPSAVRYQTSDIRYQISEDGKSLFPEAPVAERATIAVARDEAFSFYYQDNLDLLRAHGAGLLPFSPLRDAAIPGGADALYLGGGFPEMYARQLAANEGMLESVRRAIGAGMPVYAECGGLMFLTREIEDAEGGLHPMVGAVPGRCSMRDKRLSLGYAEVRFRHETLLGPAGIQARGHEFHYSRWDGLDPVAGAHVITNRAERIEGFARGNLLASFVHLHFGSNPALAPAFVASAAAYARRRRGKGQGPRAKE